MTKKEIKQKMLDLLRDCNDTAKDEFYGTYRDLVWFGLAALASKLDIPLNWDEVEGENND